MAVWRDRSGRWGPRRVVVCDDSAGFRRLVALVLQELDDAIVVGEAVDGAEAVARATELAADVVVLDLEMPRTNGLEALPQLLALEPAPRVIAFSSDPELGQAAVARGATAYVEKGAPVELLLDAVRVAGATGDGA